MPSKLQAPRSKPAAAPARRQARSAISSAAPAGFVEGSKGTASWATTTHITWDVAAIVRSSLGFIFWMAVLLVCAQHDQLLPGLIGGGLFSVSGPAGDVVQRLAKR